MRGPGGAYLVRLPASQRPDAKQG